MKEFILKSDVTFEILELIEEENKVVAFCRRSEQIREEGPYMDNVIEGSTSTTNLVNIYHFKEYQIVMMDRLVDRFQVYEDHGILNELQKEGTDTKIKDYLQMVNEKLL